MTTSALVTRHGLGAGMIASALAEGLFSLEWWLLAVGIILIARTIRKEER